MTEWSSSGIAGLARQSGSPTRTAGFGAASAFTLPSGFATDEFDAITDTSGSNPTCALLDLAGDGRVDLVVSEWSSSGIAGLGTTSWLLYPNLCP